MAKYINIDFHYEADAVIQKTVKLEYVNTIEKLYLGVQAGVAGRLIILANSQSIFDSIVVFSSKQQVFCIEKNIATRLKIDASFLLFQDKASPSIEPHREGEIDPSLVPNVVVEGQMLPSPPRNKDEKLLTILLLVHV